MVDYCHLISWQFKISYSVFGFYWIENPLETRLWVHIILVVIFHNWQCEVIPKGQAFFISFSKAFFLQNPKKEAGTIFALLF